MTSRASYWQNKVALVTGGSAGLGLAIAQALAKRGANVAMVGRDEARLQTAAEQIANSSTNTLPLRADVTVAEEVERMIAATVEHFGQLDLVVNCAGISMRGEVLQTPPAEFLRLFETNFLSMVRVIQTAAPHLTKTRGHIVNIGSLASKSATRFLGAYPASKYPVAALSQQLRLELEPVGVHTLLVCPGPLRRDDAGARYAEQSANLPAAARQPGGGVKLKGIEPERLAEWILAACERRQAELVVPWRAKLLFALSQLSPALGDWLLRRMMK